MFFNKTVDSIIAPLNKILNDLKVLQDKKGKELSEHYAKMKAAELEQDRATALIERLGKLLVDKPDGA